jgi:hypothetical protein
LEIVPWRTVDYADRFDAENSWELHAGGKAARGRRCAIACSSAEIVSRFASVRSSAQPTTFREKASRITARIPETSARYLSAELTLIQLYEFETS